VMDSLYSSLDEFGSRVGVRPEDALFVWASETKLRPDESGSIRSFAGIPASRAVGVIPKSIWDAIPDMTPSEQLSYVESVIFLPAKKILGRPFANAFEVYLATLAPGLLRPDGRYSVETPLYTGRSYPDHWTMDEFPTGLEAYRVWACGRSGESTSIRSAYPPVATALARNGRLKGYVSLGDLRAFAKRSDPERDQALGLALAQLAQARSAGEVELETLHYAPDLDSLFSGTPDLRAPSPSEARRASPGRDFRFSVNAKWVFATVVSAGILAVGVSIHNKHEKKS